MGGPDQPEYLNAVVLVDADDITPDGWLELAHELEQAGGRVRDPERRFGPRTLDVDVIVVWDGDEQVTQDDPVLTLPHPRAHLRAFVLVPLLEIAPDTVLAGHGPISDLLKTEEIAADVRPSDLAHPLHSSAAGRGETGQDRNLYVHTLSGMGLPTAVSARPYAARSPLTRTHP